MRVFSSKPAIVCSCGNTTDEVMDNIIQGRVCLENLANFSNKPFMLGQCHNLTPLPQDTAIALQTRTNMILYNCLLQKDTEINELINIVGKSDIGIVIGTTTTGVEENYNALKQSNHDTKYIKKRNTLYNPSAFVREYYGLDSLFFGVSSACTSGNKAIIEGARLIKANICQAVICGGVDSLNTLTINGFSSLEILSQNHTNPMSSARDGINIGEGGAVFILYNENLKSKIDQYYVEIKGYASNNDAYHITQPSHKMQDEIITKSLNMANLTTNDIDYINLHGTGTIANDTMEANLISRYFCDTPSSSIKPIIGHTLGAAGAIECAICANLVLSSRDSTPTPLPPHIYDGKYDANLAHINLATQQQIVVKNALSTSFAFGGDNSVIIVGDIQSNIETIDIKSLIPHSREMILLDSILEADDSYIITKTTIKEDNAFLENGAFPTFKSVEIMAQSLGCLRGLAQKESANKLGFLIGTRKFKIHKPFVEIGSEIITKVCISIQDESGLGVYDCEMFEGSIRQENLIATASISALNPSDEFLQTILKD